MQSAEIVALRTVLVPQLRRHRAMTRQGQDQFPADHFRRMVLECLGPDPSDGRLAPHQTDATRRLLAILEDHRGALLADEVGLGKSFVAAAVAREFKKRGHEIELVIPAALLTQWRFIALSFDIQPAILTHEALFRRPSFPLAGVAEKLIVVDEAHRFRNRSTKRFRALAIRSIGHRLLLITATPICNSIQDLLSLIHLIDADDGFRHRGVLSVSGCFIEEDSEKIARVFADMMVRRDRRVLPDSLEFGPVRKRVVRYPVSAQSERIRATLEELRFPLIGQGTHDGLLRDFLWRRLESSPAALRETIRRQLRFYRRASESLAAGSGLTKADYLRIFGDEEGPTQELLFSQLWFQPSAFMSDSTSIDREVELLETLKKLTEGEEKKRIALEELLRQGNEQALVFCVAVATAREIFHALSAIERCGLMTSKAAAVSVEGGRRVACRNEDVLDSFRKGRVRILIATDLASEGLNLQEAGIVVHYDLPWNPVKLDQRNGRASRIGQQRRTVEAIYFLPGEQRGILQKLASKNRARRRVLRRSPMRRARPIPLYQGGNHDLLNQESGGVGDVTAMKCLHVVGGRDHEVIVLGRLSGRLGFVKPPRDGFLERLHDAEKVTGAEAAVCDSVKKVVAESRAVVRGLLAIPTPCSSGAPALVKALRKRNLLDPQMADLLSHRFSAGIELLIEEMACEYLDVSRRDYLRQILVAERQLDQRRLAFFLNADLEAALLVDPDQRGV